MSAAKVTEWENPPERNRTEWEGIAEELRAHPGRWAKVADKGTYTASIKRGRLRAFRPVGHYEATSHKGHLHIRYKGGDTN